MKIVEMGKYFQRSLIGLIKMTVNFDMTYSNPGDQPIECVYEYPLDTETIFSKLITTFSMISRHLVIKTSTNI